MNSNSTLSAMDVKKQCMEALAAVGVPAQLCEFYADLQQCENDVTHATFRMQRELRDETQKTPPSALDGLLSIVQKVSKSFQSWQELVNSLANRQPSLPPLQIHTKTSQPLKCCIQTKDVKLMAGEEVMITDVSQPNRIKIQTQNGKEGYVPALSCVLPSPDSDPSSALKRLQLHLLICWSHCDKKIESTVLETISSTMSTLKDDSQTALKAINGHGVAHFEAQIKNIIDLVHKTENVCTDWSNVHQDLSNLENDLATQNKPDVKPIIDIINMLDRVIICYQDFHNLWSNYKRSLEEALLIRIGFCHDLKLLFNSRRRRHRYYEVRLTAVETITKEETTYINGKTQRTNGSLSNGECSESVDTEQLTSMSHEESTKFVVKSVIDPRSGIEISIEQAVRDGIVNHRTGQFMNPVTGQTWAIAEAMNDGRIHVERVLTTRTAPKTQSIGLITIRTQTDMCEYLIISATDTATGTMLTRDEAKQRGIVDEVAGLFLNTKTGEQLSLNDAIDAGLIIAEFDEDHASAPCETKTYAVSAVVDQVLHRPVPFPEAVRRHLIDRDSGCYVNNVTGEKVFAAEAIRRGLFKCTLVDDAASLTDIDVSNRVVVERIDRVRKKVLRSVNVLAALKKQATA